MLRDVVEVVRARSATLRGVMAVAHEMRRAAREPASDGLPRPVFDPEDPAARADLDRPGSLVHAAHQLRSKAGRRRSPSSPPSPMCSPPTPRNCVVIPRCVRILFSIVTSSFHDPLGPADQLTTREIVEVFLDGMRARPTTSHTSETSC